MTDFSWTDLHDEDPLVPGSGDTASAEHLNILGHEAENLEQNKQDLLVDEGTRQNIKTINGNSILGSGNLTIGGEVNSVNGKTGTVVLGKSDVGLGNVDNTSDANKPVSTAQQTALNAKQNTLVSGTNIKTINGESILGSGNISVGGGSGGLTGVKVDGAAQTVTDGYVNLQTKNGNYDTATNRLATQDDLYTDEIERLDRISYYGQDIEPSFEGITIEWVGGANGRYEVTGYEQGYIGTQKVIPFKFNDGTHREKFVAAISSNAFQNSSFYDIILPNTIISIGDNAFDGCSHLSSIIIPGSVVNIGDNVFDNTALGFKVYCSKGSAMATYCEANNIPYVTDVDSKDLSTKQDTLVSGTNIKTINNTSILGSGNISISGGGGDADDISYDNTTSGLTATNVQDAVDELASEKQDTQATVSQSAPSAITLADNTVYYLTNVTELELSYPVATHFECLLQIETASSGTVTITFPNTTKYIGDVPTFGNSETWEISIRDGIVVCGKAVIAS